MSDKHISYENIKVYVLIKAPKDRNYDDLFKHPENYPVIHINKCYPGPLTRSSAASSPSSASASSSLPGLAQTPENPEGGGIDVNSSTPHVPNRRRLVARYINSSPSTNTGNVAFEPEPLPSTSAMDAPNTAVLNEELMVLDGSILDILGEDLTDYNASGCDILKDFGFHYDHIATQGPSTDTPMEQVDKDSLPNDSPIDAPPDNSEN